MRKFFLVVAMALVWAGAVRAGGTESWRCYFSQGDKDMGLQTMPSKFLPAVTFFSNWAEFDGNARKLAVKWNAMEAGLGFTSHVAAIYRGHNIHYLRYTIQTDRGFSDVAMLAYGKGSGRAEKLRPFFVITKACQPRLDIVITPLSAKAYPFGFQVHASPPGTAAMWVEWTLAFTNAGPRLVESAWGGGESGAVPVQTTYYNRAGKIIRTTRKTVGGE